MVYRLEMENIKRYNCPNNSDIHEHIEEVRIERIGDFSSNIVPELGEIIVFNGNNYIVSKKIRVINEGPLEEEMILRVQEYSEFKYYCSDSKSWYERIPLFIGQ